MALLNTQVAATRLGISPRRVLAFIHDGRLPARKLGRDWLIEEADLDRMPPRLTGNRTGRPRTGKPRATPP